MTDLLRTNRLASIRTGRYISCLNDAEHAIQQLKSKSGKLRHEVMSEFNIIRMYLDKAEEQLARWL